MEVRSQGGLAPVVKKGSPNKFTADVKAAIMAAFDEVGGAVRSAF
jgi:small basic protein